MSRAKTLQLENVNRQELLTDKEEVPKLAKETKRPPVQSGQLNTLYL